MPGPRSLRRNANPHRTSDEPPRSTARCGTRVPARSPAHPRAMTRNRQRRFSHIRIVSSTSMGPVRISMVPRTRFGETPGIDIPAPPGTAPGPWHCRRSPRLAVDRSHVCGLRLRLGQSAPMQYPVAGTPVGPPHPGAPVDRSAQGVHAQAALDSPSHEIHPIALVQPRQAQDRRNGLNLTRSERSNLVAHAHRLPDAARPSGRSVAVLATRPSGLRARRESAEAQAAHAAHDRQPHHHRRTTVVATRCRVAASCARFAVPGGWPDDGASKWVVRSTFAAWRLQG